jgi:hypothetical protein
MTTTYTLLRSVRLSGSFNAQGELAIVAARDGTSVEVLEVESDCEPVILELFHFEFEGVRWTFAAAGWRTDTDAARVELPYTTGDAFLGIDITAESTQGLKRPKRISVKIKPVPDAPDELEA